MNELILLHLQASLSRFTTNVYKPRPHPYSINNRVPLSHVISYITVTICTQRNHIIINISMSYPWTICRREIKMYLAFICHYSLQNGPAFFLSHIMQSLCHQIGHARSCLKSLSSGCLGLAQSHHHKYFTKLSAQLQCSLVPR